MRRIVLGTFALVLVAGIAAALVILEPWSGDGRETAQHAQRHLDGGSASSGDATRDVI